jgi:hypothetical protein
LCFDEEQATQRGRYALLSIHTTVSPVLVSDYKQASFLSRAFLDLLGTLRLTRQFSNCDGISISIIKYLTPPAWIKARQP